VRADTRIGAFHMLVAAMARKSGITFVEMQAEHAA
jgi:hypothetical protein